MNTIHGHDGRPRKGFGIFQCGRAVLENVRHFSYVPTQAAGS
jgi:hypothetical protein